MKKFFSILLIILGIVGCSLSSLAIIGGAGMDSLILIVPSLACLIPGIRMVSHTSKPKIAYKPPEQLPYEQPGNTLYGQSDMVRTITESPKNPSRMTYPAPQPDFVPTYVAPQPVQREKPPKKSAARKTVLPEEAIHYRAAVHPEVMGALKSFVALHIEPSGFVGDSTEPPRKAREIYAIRFVNGQVKEDFFLRINPEKPETNAQQDNRTPHRLVPNGRFAAPGFTPQPMITELSERNAFQKLMNFLGDDVTDGKVCLVGHGILRVDMPLLQVSLAKLGYHSRDMLHVIDVEDIALEILQLPDYSLPALARYYGIPAPDSEEAAKDPFLSGQVLLRMITIP